MPRAPMRCSPTCPKPAFRYGKCRDHQPQREAWAGKREREFLKSAEWDRQRRRVLFRDDHTCQICGASDANHVDHIIPVWYTKKEQVTDDELQTLCESCHTKKSSYEGVQAKKIRRANGLV